MTSAQLKNSFYSIGELDAAVAPSTLELKLCANFQSLRYFVVSKTHHQVVFFGSYTLHHIHSNAELVERLSKIFEKDEVLQLKFGSVIVGFDVPYDLVPQEFSFALKQDGQLAQSFENGFDLLYAEQTNIDQLFKSHFGHFKAEHINTSFLRLLPTALFENSDKLFVNVGPEFLDIIRFDEAGKLLLMNRYEYKDANDFIYFTALSTEDLKIDREKTELVLIGEVDIQSKIYDQCYKYFRNVSFIHKPDSIGFTSAFDLFPKHLHFNLYNL